MDGSDQPPAAPDAPLRDENGRYLAGQSGNPAGKKPGTRNRATLFRALLQEGELEAAARAIVDRAVAGHYAASRFLVDALEPKPRGRPIDLQLPDGGTADDAWVAVLRRVLSGDVTAEEALQLRQLIEHQRRLTDEAVSGVRSRDRTDRTVAAPAPDASAPEPVTSGPVIPGPVTPEPVAARRAPAGLPRPVGGEMPAFRLHPQAPRRAAEEARAPAQALPPRPDKPPRLKDTLLGSTSIGAAVRASG